MSRRGRPTRASIHNQLGTQINELRQRLGGLPTPAEAEGIWTEIWYSEAHSSTGIEGNTLVLKEVAELLRSGRAVGNKPLKDYTEVKGYADAARWVYGQETASDTWNPDNLVALAEVRQIHAAVMTPVWEIAPHPLATPDEAPGNWRQHNLQPLSHGLIARAIINNLSRFVIPAVAGPARLVPLEALVTPDLSLVAMRAAIERGRLWTTIRSSSIQRFAAANRTFAVRGS